MVKVRLCTILHLFERMYTRMSVYFLYFCTMKQFLNNNIS